MKLKPHKNLLLLSLSVVTLMLIVAALWVLPREEKPSVVVDAIAENTAPRVETILKATTELVESENVEKPQDIKFIRKAVKSEVIVPLEIKEHVDPMVQLIAGLTHDQNFFDRQKAIADLPNNLPEAAVATLINYLSDLRNARKGNLWDLSNKNDVLQVLIDQETLHPALGQTILAISNDKTQDPIWRDYNIQFIPAYARRKYKELKAPLDFECNEIVNSLLSAIETDSGEITGTALLGLSRIVQNKVMDALVDKTMVIEQAKSLLNKANATEMERITAIQTMGQMGNKEYLESSLAIVQNPEYTVMERMAAIATVGQIGNEEDIASMNEFFKKSDQVEARLNAALSFVRRKSAKSDLNFLDRSE